LLDLRQRRRWVRKSRDEKMKFMTPVERGGSARSLHVDRLTAAAVNQILGPNTSPESTLNTDEASYYKSPGRRLAKHETVLHSAEEYVRVEVHTNTVEGFFSIFKRRMIGIYRHCGEKHFTAT
jgi:ISXO2-like transposase domain